MTSLTYSSLSTLPSSYKCVPGRFTLEIMLPRTSCSFCFCFCCCSFLAIAELPGALVKPFEAPEVYPLLAPFANPLVAELDAGDAWDGPAGGIDNGGDGGDMRWSLV